MRPRDRKRHQLGRFWLYQRPDTRTWSICWLDSGAISGSGGGAVTRRKAMAVAGGTSDQPPQAALDALAAHHLEHGVAPKQTRMKAIVENLIAEWLRHHVVDLAALERYVASTLLWTEFFDIEVRAGRLPRPVTVATVTPMMTKRFVDWRRSAGVGGHMISRDLAALRGALNWAWKNHRIESVPFIADVPATQKAAPRDRVLSFQEIARILDLAGAVPERQHVRLFVIVELGIAGRPDAVLELHAKDIDLERGLIDPNGTGRRHLRKRRPIVPIAERKRIPGGPTHFEKDTASIKTSWTAICAEAGIAGATPKTLRHTMLTWLATGGVPKEERMALAGHTPQDTTSRNYEHLTPDYLQGAIREIDAFFNALTKHTKSHLRSGYDPFAPALRLVG